MHVLLDDLLMGEYLLPSYEEMEYLPGEDFLADLPIFPLVENEGDS